MYSTRHIKGAKFHYKLLNEFKVYPTVKQVNKIIIVTFDKKEADFAASKHGDKAKIIVLMHVSKERYDLVAKLECYYIVCVSLDELNTYMTKPVDINETRTYMTFGSNTLRKFYFHLRLRSWSQVRRATFTDLYMLTHRVLTFPNMYNIQSIVKQGSNIEISGEVTSKDLLYKNFGGDFIPKIISLNELDDDFGLTIFKPREGSLGEGIFTIDTKKEGWRDTLKEHYKKEGEPYAICKYIDNPLLFKERKFHLRSLMMLTSWGTYHTFPISRILHAELPYQHDDYLNPKIHDSHAKSTIGYPVFPKDLPYQDKVEMIYDQIKYIHKVCFDKVPIVCYPETKWCFNVFGLDLMIDDNFKVWVLEINKAPLMQSWFDNGGPSDEFDRQFSNWFLNNIMPKL